MDNTAFARDVVSGAIKQLVPFTRTQMDATTAVLVLLAYKVRCDNPRLFDVQADDPVWREMLADRTSVLETFTQRLEELARRDARCRFWPAALTLPGEAAEAFATCAYRMDNVYLGAETRQHLASLAGPLVDFALRQDRGSELASYTAFRSLARVTASLLEPKAGDRIYDSACGLLEQLIAVQLQHPETPLHLYGQDSNLLALALAQIKALMNGIDDVQLELGDTLASPGFREEGRPRQFEIVVSTPPFGLRTTDPAQILQLPGRFPYGEPRSRNLELSFAQDALYRTLRGGQTLVTVPSGVLSRSGQEAEIRRSMLATGLLNLVVSLPMGTLVPLTRIHVHLLRFQAGSEERQDQVLFVDATQDPFKVAFGMPEPDVAVWVQQLIERPENFPTQARWVSHEEIERQGMNWLPEIYFASEEPPPDLDALHHEVGRQTQVADLARTAFLNALKEIK